VACHYEVTRAQHKELKELRRKEKEHLKNALNQLKKVSSLFWISIICETFFNSSTEGFKLS
jgi:hypothetical protein